MFVAAALLIIGLILLAYGADRLVFSAAILCRSFGIPPLIIGMTVVSIGTSLPEMILSFSAAQRDQQHQRQFAPDQIGVYVQRVQQRCAAEYQ